MSTPATRTAPVRLANFKASAPDELRDICDIWLSAICQAGWSTREAHRVAAYLASCVYGNRENELFLRDVESALNIQPEESQRALKLLKLFGVIDELSIERGKLSVEIRVTLENRMRLAEAQAKLAGIAASDVERAMNSGIAALKAAAAQKNLSGAIQRGASQPDQPRYAFDDADLQKAIGE